MFNPLINFTQYTDTQLEEKITELQKKYFQTQNPQLQQQIVVSLENFKTELETRQAIARQKQREQTESNDDSDLDSLININ